MNQDEWEAKVHLRTPKCCVRCAHYSPGYEGEGGCEHPDAVLTDSDGDEYAPSTSHFQRCDWFAEEKA